MQAAQQTAEHERRAPLRAWDGATRWEERLAATHTGFVQRRTSAVAQRGQCVERVVLAESTLTFGDSPEASRGGGKVDDGVAGGLGAHEWRAAAAGCGDDEDELLSLLNDD